jgi:hypothetical protein
MMTFTTLKWMILCELKEQEDNLHSLHVENKEEVIERLIEPEWQYFSNFSDEIRGYWIVWDECPSDPSTGYLIVYSEKDELFGLATKPRQEKAGFLLGLYGSFVDVLNNM